jgi:subtilisin family serine protease
MPDHLRLPEPYRVVSRRTSGGPSGQAPASRAYHGSQLARHLDSVDELAEEAGEIDTDFIIKLSGRTRLTPPYQKWKLVHLGEGPDWSYYVLASSDARENLRRLFNDYAASGDDGEGWEHAQSWSDFVRDLTGLEFYGPEDRFHPSLDELTFENLELLDVSIWPSESSTEAQRRVAVVQELVTASTERASNIRTVATDARPETTMARVRADRPLLDRLLRTSVVELIRQPPRPRITIPELYRDIMLSGPGPEGGPVGVIDDGVITSNRYLTNAIVASKSFPEDYTFTQPSDHGTAVCGLAAYGDFETSIINGTPLPPPCAIAHARVLEPDGAGRTRFAPTQLHHVTMGNAIRWLVEECGVRVIVASISDPYGYDGPLVDEWTQVVDQLARELNVVVVVPTGNTPMPFGEALPCGCHVLNDYPHYLEHPEARLASPGIGAVVVTVGSVAPDGAPGGDASKLPIAGPGKPSPFTRVGPGPGRTKDGARKPEFVAVGGNWSYDQTLRRVDDKDPSTNTVSTTRPVGSRQLGIFSGTSFSAPRVAHAIASIADRYPGVTANMLRALAAIGARRSDALDISFEDLSPLDVGVYGSINTERAIESGGPRVILIYEGEMTADSVTIHRIPMPRRFLEGYTPRTIRIALAYDPPIRRQRREYIAGSMAFDLVRGSSLTDLEQRYRKQPTRAEAETSGIPRLDLPRGRPALNPGISQFYNNTLICRSFSASTGWDEEVLDYFVVVVHQRSSWSTAQKASYAEQRYALAIEMYDEARNGLNLYALVRAQLRGQARVRTR